MTENILIPIEHTKIVLERMKKSKIFPERMLDWDKVSDIHILDLNKKTDDLMVPENL